MPEEQEQLGGLGIPSLADAIEKLKAHPEIISMAASVLGQSAEMPPTPPTEDDTPPEIISDEKTDTSTFGGSVSDALPSLMGLLGPMTTYGGGSKEGKPHHGSGIGRSTALLLALKPYLSKSRCETIDRLVQLGKLGEILEKLS